MRPPETSGRPQTSVIAATAPAVPAPGADHLVAQVQLPVGVALGGLLGEVDVGEKSLGSPLVRSGHETNVAEQLVAAAR